MQSTSAAAAEDRRPEGSDPPTLRDLVEDHGRSVFRLAYRLTRNEEDAEDVVQESFIKIHRSLDTFEERSQIGTWIHRVVANTAIDLLRRRNRMTARYSSLDEAMDLGRDPVAPTLSPERLAEGRQIGERVARALETLSDIERTAFILRHYEGHSTAEIGAMLDLGPSATKHAVFRAVKKLRRILSAVRTQPGTAPDPSGE